MEFIIDDFTRARGEPALLQIFCSQCHSHLMTYQKDGGGPLLRCYWDRIHAPDRLKQLLKETHPTSLDCPTCHQRIGERILYEKEQRWAFHLIEEKSFYKVSE